MSGVVPVEVIRAHRDAMVVEGVRADPFGEWLRLREIDRANDYLRTRQSPDATQ